MPNLNYDVPQDFEGNETMSESMSESMSKSMSELERTRMQIILHYLDTNKEINSSIAAKLLKVEIKTASGVGDIVVIQQTKPLFLMGFPESKPFEKLVL